MPPGKSDFSPCKTNGSAETARKEGGKPNIGKKILKNHYPKQLNTKCLFERFSGAKVTMASTLKKIAKNTLLLFV